MTFFDFFTLWNGKICNYPGALGGQCVDLARQYVTQALGCPADTMKGKNAVDIYQSRNWPNVGSFTFIDNKLWNTPKQGDVVVWGTQVDQYGHIAIFNEGNVFRFTSFDQNWGPDRHCRLVNHSYFGVLGWLRKK